MTPENTLPIKHSPGHPKGSKNKPDAGTKGNPIGRPKKHPLTNNTTDSDTLTGHKNNGKYR
jgi:hypothetical protein